MRAYVWLTCACSTLAAALRCMESSTPPMIKIPPMNSLGVIGWPVAHSRSPAMHNAALRHVGLEDWRYQLLPVAPELFAETVRALPAAGFRGVNVTIPHKRAALALADEATSRARAIGAANFAPYPPCSTRTVNATRRSRSS